MSKRFYINDSVLTPNELRKISEIVNLANSDVMRIDRRVRREKLEDLLVTLGDQYSVDLFLTEDPSSFNSYAVFIRSRDLCNKVGVRILFDYDEIFFGSPDHVIRKIISEIKKMKEPIEKPTPVKVCADKLIPRLCTCCGAPLPKSSNTCEYCGVSHMNPLYETVEEDFRDDRLWPKQNPFVTLGGLGISSDEAVDCLRRLSEAFSECSHAI